MGLTVSRFTTSAGLLNFPGLQVGKRKDRFGRGGMAFWLLVVQDCLRADTDSFAQVHRSRRVPFLKSFNSFETVKPF